MTGPSTPTTVDLVEITERVWQTYLDPHRANPLRPGRVVGSHEDMIATVSITGGWRGHVVLTSSPGAARRAAATLLSVAPHAVSAENMFDVLGELANIVGGGIKGVLPPGCSSSLPQVTAGRGTTVHFPSAAPVCELAATWHGEPMTFSMWKHIERAEARAA